MFLIKSTYIGKAKTRQLIFWGKLGKYIICNINEHPDKSWIIMNGIYQHNQANNRLSKIPDRMFFKDTEFILCKNEIIKYKETIYE